MSVVLLGLALSLGALVLGYCFGICVGAREAWASGIKEGRRAADAEWALHLEHGAL